MEDWAKGIYAKTVLCVLPPTAAPSRPDQPVSHIPLVRQVEDPLANVTIPCFGDQLTRVRVAGAKDLRSGSHTPKDRLDYIYPFREELSYKGNLF